MSSSSQALVLYQKPLTIDNSWLPEKIAAKIHFVISAIITQSSTRESLKDGGYPQAGKIEETIRS